GRLVADGDDLVQPQRLAVDGSHAPRERVGGAHARGLLLYPRAQRTHLRVVLRSAGERQRRLVDAAPRARLARLCPRWTASCGRRALATRADDDTPKRAALARGNGGLLGCAEPLQQLADGLRQ